MKRFGLFLAILLTLLTGTALTAGYPSEGVPTKSQVAVRAEPGSRAKKLAQVGKRDVVIILGEAEDASGNLWYMVELKDGTQGYINAETLTLSGGTQSSSGLTKTMSVSIRAACDDYNHVGNDWIQSFTVGGVECRLRDTNTVTMTAGKKVAFTSEIVEADKKPDVGNGYTSRIISEKDLQNGFTVTQTVTVRENGGRYSGNTCEWEVIFTVR